jgi:prophage regulatory protein
MSDILITQNDVLALTGLSRRAVLRLRDRGAFPQPLKIGPHNILFKRTEVQAWLRANPPAPLKPLRIY